MSKYKPITNQYSMLIVNNIKDYLKTTNKNRITIDTLDICHLIGIIDKLIEENKEIRAIQKEDRDSANWWRNRYKAQVNICKTHHTNDNLDDGNNKTFTRSSRYSR